MMKIEIPPYMRAVQLIGHGDYDKLICRDDVPTPKPRANEVLIKVSAAAINNTDINIRIGWYAKSDKPDEAAWDGSAFSFPRIQGADLCGVIVAVGQNIDQSRLGERVLVNPCLTDINGQKTPNFAYLGSEFDGAFAQYCAVSAKQAHKIDSDYLDHELASFPCSYSTAENLLTRANIGADDVVLISGASGGVGSAAIGLAKARGAKIIAVTQKEKFAHLQAIGADQLVDRNSSLLDSVGTNAVTAVIDLVAGPHWQDYLEILKPFGRYATSGAIAGPIVEMDLRTLYLKDISIFGCTCLADGVFDNLVRQIESKAIRPLVAKTFPLEQIVAAQKEFLTKNHIGKIVLTIDG